MNKRILKNRKGGVAVEFALTAPILLALVLGVVDFGRAALMAAKLSGAARIGAQYAIGVSDADEDAIEDAVLDAVDFGNPDNLSISVSNFCECAYGEEVDCGDDCDGEDPHKFISVNLSYQHDLYFSYPGVDNPMTLNKEATMRLE